MKYVAIAALLVAAILFYPQLSEDADGACHALERRVIAQMPPATGADRSDSAAGRAFLGALLGGLSNGSFAAAFVKQRHPNLPPFVGCVLTYWRVVLDPAVVEQLARDAGFGRGGF